MNVQLRKRGFPRVSEHRTCACVTQNRYIGAARLARLRHSALRCAPHKQANRSATKRSVKNSRLSNETAWEGEGQIEAPFGLRCLATVALQVAGVNRDEHTIEVQCHDA